MSAIFGLFLVAMGVFTAALSIGGIRLFAGAPPKRQTRGTNALADLFPRGGRQRFLLSILELAVCVHFAGALAAGFAVVALASNDALANHLEVVTTVFLASGLGLWWATRRGIFRRDRGMASDAASYEAEVLASLEKVDPDEEQGARDLGAF
jgi:hypothetical protein